MDTKHDAVLKNGEKVYRGQKVVVGFGSPTKNGNWTITYGVVLEDLQAAGFADEPTWGCDLFFRNPRFEEHDSLGYLWLEESKLDCAQFSTPQAAVEYAEGTLCAMQQHLQDAGYLKLDGSRGDRLTIFAPKTRRERLGRLLEACGG